MVALTSAPEGLGLLLLAGALLYLIGVFGVTMAINVPLNNRLAALVCGQARQLARVAPLSAALDPVESRPLGGGRRWDRSRLTLAALRLG